MRILIPVVTLALTCACGSPDALSLDYGLDRTKSLIVSGTEITYLDTGQGHTVVFYHPVVDFRYWQWSIDAAATAYRVIALPHGAAMPGTVPFDPASLIAFLEQAVDTPVHLVAHSFGGWQALALAVNRPDLVRSLVLVEPGGSPDLASLGAQENETGPCSLVDPTDQELSACQTANLVAGEGYFENASPVFKRIWIASVAALEESLLSGGSSEPSPPVLPPDCAAIGALPMPVLFLRGDATPAAMQRGLDVYEGCLPPHDTAVIEGASHFVHLDNAPAFNRALLDFVARH